MSGKRATSFAKAVRLNPLKRASERPPLGSDQLVESECRKKVACFRDMRHE